MYVHSIDPSAPRNSAPGDIGQPSLKNLIAHWLEAKPDVLAGRGLYALHAGPCLTA